MLMEMQNEYEKTMAFAHVKKSGGETGKGSVVSRVWPAQPEFMGSRGAPRRLTRYALGTPSLSLAPFWSNYS